VKFYSGFFLGTPSGLGYLYAVFLVFLKYILFLLISEKGMVCLSSFNISTESCFMAFSADCSSELSVFMAIKMPSLFMKGTQYSNSILNGATALATTTSKSSIRFFSCRVFRSLIAYENIIQLQSLYNMLQKRSLFTVCFK